MSSEREPKLVKFMITASAMLFIGTFQGLVQVIGPVRSWLMSIGTPVSNPGRLIDPLAHVHINLIGGLVLFMMCMIYYHLPRMSGKPIYSLKLIEYSFWWLTIGVFLFYSSLLFFGITEGILMLEGSYELQAAVHQFYTPVIVVCAVIVTFGYGSFFYNIARTLLNKNVESPKAGS